MNFRTGLTNVGFLISILALFSLCRYEHQDVLEGRDFDNDILTAQFAKLHSCGYLNASPASLLLDGDMALRIGFLETYFPDPCPQPSGEESPDDGSLSDARNCATLQSGVRLGQAFLLLFSDNCAWYTRKDREICLSALNLSPCEAGADRQLAALILLEDRYCMPDESSMIDSHLPLQGVGLFPDCRRRNDDWRHILLWSAYWNAMNGNIRL